jgi:hypothetical protein
MRDEFDNTFAEESERNIEIPLTVQKDTEPAVIPFHKKRWISWVSAADILIIFGTSAYFVISD